MLQKKETRSVSQTMGKRFGISSLGLLDVITLHNVQIRKEKNLVDSLMQIKKKCDCSISCTLLMSLFLGKAILKRGGSTHACQ